ncbi:uncharacterized protein LOC134227951 [Armigeres subalbatus]|uniref:uncharacterized protein LOC134225400 n=1 Tax=Armigeres subalbatus TaxID=124917 RepID=UPI002ED07C85
MAQSNITTTLEPFRKGCSFSDWVDRLRFFFNMNKVPDDAKRDHFITLSGPVIFRELKLLYPNTDLAQIDYTEMVSKLKARLDKTESDLVQRLKFNVRMQQPDESLEDFVLSVKLQAEFCNFENFKEMAVRDRIVAGIRDKALQQRLLNEEKLSLESAEKLIATWEIARNNAINMDFNSGLDQIAALKANGGSGTRLQRLAATMELASRSLQNEGRVERGSVKSRLGYSPYKKDQWRNRQWRTNNGQSRQSDNRRWNDGMQMNDEGPRRWKSPDYSQMVCDFCKVKGHIKRKCFKLKNMKRDAVNKMNSNESGDNPELYLSELVNRMRTESDSESEVEDSNWKRVNHGPSKSTTFE